MNGRSEKSPVDDIAKKIYEEKKEQGLKENKHPADQMDDRPEGGWTRLGIQDDEKGWFFKKESGISLESKSGGIEYQGGPTREKKRPWTVVE